MKSKLILIVVLFCSVAGIFWFITTDPKEQPASAKSGNSPTKVFHLYAADLEDEIQQGTTLYSWGFGLWDPEKNAPASPPTVPGPEIRVKEGDHVKVVFHNEQKELHTIHFHGVDNSFAGDGTPGVSQRGVKKGETFTYEFDAKHEGTYWYHCHVEPDRHPEMGLYGAFIIEPKTPKYTVDGEFTLMLAERDPHLSLAEGQEALEYEGTGAEHLHLEGDYDTVNRKAQFYTINGKVEPDIPPLHVKEGGKYVIRLINAGSEVHTFHTHGHHFKVVASDGRAYPATAEKDSITIGPGEKFDLLLTADNPGIWPIHCHMGPHSTHGMHMMMIYDGFEHSMAHNNTSPLITIKHHLALLKEYRYEKKYNLMKNEMKEINNGLQGFYQSFGRENFTEWEQLTNTITTINQLLNGTIHKDNLEKQVNRLDEQLNNMEAIMQKGDPT